MKDCDFCKSEDRDRIETNWHVMSLNTTFFKFPTLEIKNQDICPPYGRCGCELVTVARSHMPINFCPLCGRKLNKETEDET